METNHKILINSKGVPVLVEVPEKPTTPKPSELISGDWTHQLSEEVWSVYQQSVSTAISDESKHIHIKDQIHILRVILDYVDYTPDDIVTCKAKQNIGQTFDLPPNIGVSFEDDCQRYKDHAHVGGNVKCQEQCYFSKGGLKVCKKLAILTPKENSAHAPSKDVYKGAEELFCKIYSDEYGEVVDSIYQIKIDTFDGLELLTLCEKFAQQSRQQARVDGHKGIYQALYDLCDHLTMIDEEGHFSRLHQGYADDLREMVKIGQKELEKLKNINP